MITRVLFFDIGNVLVPFDPQIAIRELAGSTPYSPEILTERLRRWRRISDFECGMISTEQFFAELSAYLRLSGLSFERFAKIWSGIFMDEMLISSATLDSLRDNYRLVLISNTNPLHFGFIRERFPRVGDFDDAVLSFQVGAMKPAREIFLNALQRSGCAPEESFFVDDIEDNVRGAQEVGIPGVRFKDEKQLLEALAKHGIHCGMK